MLLQVIFLAVAINLDSFVAGLAYGIADTRLPRGARLIVSVAAGCSLALAISAGDFLRGVLPGSAAEILSIGLLLVFGCFLMWRNTKEAKKISSEEPDSGEKTEDTLWQLNLALFGVIIKVLKDPDSCCDPDSEAGSRISFCEALFLGLALSLDALGAGLTIGVLGLPIGLTVILAIGVNYLLLTVGAKIGGKFGSLSQRISEVSHRFAAYIPAIVLLMLGVWKLIEFFLG